MKNTSLILNFILLAAVGILYYFHFSQKPVAEPGSHVVSLSNFRIAYVDSDSLLEQYQYFTNKKKSFEEKQNSIKMELSAETSKLQGEIEAYQKQAGFMTDQERGKREEELGMKQQQILRKKDELINRLDEEQNRMNEELYNKLGGFMKEFNKMKNYSFILGYQRGGGILYANDSLNITKEVVEGLNRDYESEGKKSK